MSKSVGKIEDNSDQDNMHDSKAPRCSGEKDLIASELERLSTAIVKMINTRDWSMDSPATAEIFDHVSPSFRGFLPNDKQKEMTAEELTAWMVHKGEILPDYKIEIVHMSADVEHQAGKASVHMEFRETIEATGVRIQAFNEFEWKRSKKRRDSKWLLTRLTSFRGFASDDSISSDDGSFAGF